MFATRIFSGSAVLLLISLLFSCSSTSRYGEPVIKPAAALKSVMNFLVYRQKYLRLSEDFTGIDSAENTVSRKAFFKQLSTGRYLPLRLTSADSTAVYQLHPIVLPEHEEIQGIVKQWGEQLHLFQQMEGKPFATFPLKDVTGNVYDKANTAGKIIALKCWFINCVPCVKEMPALNELVRKYSPRKDVLFVSLALDKKAALDSFLKKRQFNYAVVPETRGLIESLNVTSFPTHILINKQGLIVRYLWNETELATALKTETAK